MRLHGIGHPVIGWPLGFRAVTSDLLICNKGFNAPPCIAKWRGFVTISTVSCPDRHATTWPGVVVSLNRAST